MVLAMCKRMALWGGVLVSLLVVLLGILPAPAQAAPVTQLDITSESVSLNFGALGTLSGTFNQNGLLIMGQF